MKVLVFGTFDLFHKGHESFLQQALEQGDKLVVGVSSDENVKKYKGSLPFNNQAKRIDRLRKLDFVKEIFPAREDHDFMKTIRGIDPDVICLGYDQENFGLVSEIDKTNMKIKVVRLKAFKEDEYKSSIIKNIID